jgi:hypothetical protein
MVHSLIHTHTGLEGIIGAVLRARDKAKPAGPDITNTVSGINNSDAAIQAAEIAAAIAAKYTPPAGGGCGEQVGGGAEVSGEWCVCVGVVGRWMRG